MRISILAAALLSNGLVIANPLLARQDSTTTSSVSSNTSLSSTSTSTTSVPTSAATTSATVSTSTSSTSSTSSSSSSGSAPTSTDLPSGIASCSQGDADSFYTNGSYTGSHGLCGISGNNNTIVIPDGGLMKFVTWYIGAYPGPDAEVTVHLNWMDNSGRLVWNATEKASKGFTIMSIDSSFLDGASSSRFQLVLDARFTSNGIGATTHGPVITFLQQNNTPPAPPPTSFNFLGLVIGVPVAVAVIAAVLGVFCCVTNRHKSFFGKIRLPTRRRGYGVRQSRRQRTGAPTDDFDFDASAPIYRDEPGADYSASTREERSARAMGVFSAERNLHSTH